MSYIVAIVGRPNVGKSRLFNRVSGAGDAIVHGEPGVTRDRQYAVGAHGDVDYTVVDTGGMVPEGGEDLVERMHAQADVAIEEADAVILVLDARTGLMPADRQIAEKLRQSEKPVYIAVNKVDPGTQPEQMVAEFYELGADLFPISAEHDEGVAEMMDEVVADARAMRPPDSEEVECPRCAVVGKPNVGKSTLVNKLLGDERLVTSDIPGTTRDAVDMTIERDGQRYQLIDTAGLRREANIDATLEELAVVHALKSIDRADVAAVLIEASEGVTRQDKKIADVVVGRGTACVVLVNKWDLLEKHEQTGDLYRAYLDRELDFLDWAPFHFISARTGRGIGPALESIDEAWENYRRRIDTSPLNDFVDGVVARHTPPTEKGREVKIYYATQAGTEPPTFVFFANYPEQIDDSYQRYLENELREAYQFRGTPIRIHVRERD